MSRGPRSPIRTLAAASADGRIWMGRVTAVFAGGAGWEMCYIDFSRSEVSRAMVDCMVRMSLQSTVVWICLRRLISLSVKMIF